MDWSVLGRALRYLTRYRTLAAVAYGCLLVSTAAQLMVPQLVQRILDAMSTGFIAQQLAQVPAAFLPMALERVGWTAEQFARYSTGAESALISSGVLIVAFAAARGIFHYIQGVTAERLSQSVAFELRNEIFAKVQRLSFSYHDRNQTGALMIRATDDVERFRTFLGQGLLMAVQAVVLITVSLSLLFATNPRLTLVVLPVMPVAVLVFVGFSGIAMPLFSQVQQRLSRLNTVLQENLAGIKVVKSFAREPQQQDRFEASADELLATHLQLARLFSFLFPLVFLMGNLGQATILYFGGQQIIRSTLTLGQYQKFSMYLMFILFPLGMLSMIITQLSQAVVSAQRIFDILDAQIEVRDKPGAPNLPPVQGRVEFQDVTFRYFGERGEPALDRVSLTAEPGQTIALLGATGSGKSTIINLIPRFYDASEGRVLIDGHDVRDVCLDSLRRQIGIVLQDTTLFSGSIRENIAFGRPQATLDEVIAAAKAAQAHEFITSFAQGYDTPVGERGATLSGGQKQRIAIARALLMDPRILILDDSTSSVDAVTEYQMQQTLGALMRGRTSFVIAQRISTVRTADQIVVLDKGKVAAWGKHEDLMENSPIYAEIYHSQLVEDTAPAAGRGEEEAR